MVAETLRRETSRLGPALHILDVGGGDGMDAVPLALRGHRVTVLDRSHDWLDEARRRAAAAGTELETVVGDLDDPPALDELAADTARTLLFDDDVRKIPVGEAEVALRRAGLPVVRRYGTRIANDLLGSDEVKHDADGFAELLRLELALCDREPFVRVGGMYQLIASRP